MHRRRFLQSALSPLLIPASAASPPVKIGHREASMRLVGDPRVFEIASQIPGLNGVELQIVSGKHNLWSRQTLTRYKNEAHRWGLRIPSLAGPFPAGASIRSLDAADHLKKAIECAAFLGASVLLVPFFRDNCPDMSKPEEYSPVVGMLRAIAPRAADQGLTLGLENSLSPAGNAQLCDFVAHPGVRVYFDLDNGEFYGHHGQIVPGIRLLGKDRICQVHVKNEDRLIQEDGRIPWRKALAELAAIGYDSWYVLESRHTSTRQCIDSTTKNMEFIRQVLQP
ncbi:MAG: sugar phosphate isomerase/epimerase [Acidimicrobiia bacterium]|nr:sugar phosphate isomerase/epimerase [Acidimicrobiia bacterium]